MPAAKTLKREFRVATSRRAQPVWFRIAKWAFAIIVTAWLWRSPYFWWWIAGGLGLGLAVHFIWRWKTKGWTQPWFGWNDVEAGKKD
jgi:hypothetical protein